MLPLSKAIDERIGDMPEVRRYTGTTYFSAMAVVREQSVLFEAYAPDFGPDRPHSMQSVGKTAASLILGRLVEDGRVELDRKVAHYLPEIGTATRRHVQQVLDMDVVNNFDEGYGRTLLGRSPSRHAGRIQQRRNRLGPGACRPPASPSSGAGRLPRPW